MPKYLLIVESPVKSVIFQKYLGDDYIVIGTAGHIGDLVKTGKVENYMNLETYEPIYEKLDKPDIFNKIEKAIKKCDIVYISTDADREGENIAFCIKTFFNIKNYKRIIYRSTNKEEIIKALKNPMDINMNLVYAQQTRRLIDRLYGFLISPLLSLNNTQWKSAGRVQSNITKIIIEKEEEIKNYFLQKHNSFFNITANININKNNLNVGLTKNEDDNSSNKTKTKFEKDDDEKIKKIMKKISNSNLNLEDIKKKDKKQNAPPPFMTTTLQQYCSSFLKLNSKQTMTIAQNLYENGYITYIRTDSFYLCDEFLEQAQTYIIDNIGEDYHKKNIYEGKNNNNAQEAHEAIRPTNINVSNINTENTLNNKVYNVIWKRTIQSQMKPAIYENVNLEISISKLKDYKFIGNIETLVYDGYLKLDDKEVFPRINLENFKNKNIEWNNIIADEDIKRPPPRYDEASLLKYLTDLSIVRPSTASSSVIKPIERNYIEITNIEGVNMNANKYIITNENINEINIENKIIKLGDEKNKFVSTELGRNVTTYLETNFNMLIDKNFTIKMEKNLDDIANGKIIKIDIIKPFYEYITNIITNMNIKRPINNNNVIGLINDKEVILVKTSKYKFVVCDEDKINVEELYNDNSPNIQDILDFIKPKLSKNIGKINDVDVIIKYGMHGYYATCGDDKVNLEPIIENGKIPKKKELLKYIEKSIPKNIGKINSLCVILKYGKNGYYLNYNDFNYNVNTLFENEQTPTNEQLLNKLNELLNNNKNLKTWKIKKNLYTLKNGKHGYYLEEKKNNEFVKNISIGKYIENELKSKSIEEIIEDIDNKQILKLIEK